VAILVLVTVFLAKFYSGCLRLHQVEMETEKYGDQKAEHACEYVTSYYEVSNFVVKGFGLVIVLEKTG